jgi:hypothetical protein
MLPVALEKLHAPQEQLSNMPSTVYCQPDSWLPC